MGLDCIRLPDSIQLLFTDVISSEQGGIRTHAEVLPSLKHGAFKLHPFSFGLLGVPVHPL